MKLFVSIAAAAAILAALAAPALSDASRPAAPEPLTVSWSMPQLQGSAAVRPAGFEAAKPAQAASEPAKPEQAGSGAAGGRPVRVVYPGPAART